MRRKTVTQRVRMNAFLEARSLGGFLASVPDHLGVDRRITGMPAVAWKQPCAWLARYSGGVERHQQRAMIRSQSCVDESRDFILAEDRWEAMVLFRIGCLGDAPTLLECLGV